MNQKGISKPIIAVIIIVVVIVVGVAAYWALTSGGGGNGTGDGNGGGGNGGDITGNGGDGNGGTTVDVAGASSLQFSVSFTEAVVGTDVSTYRVKNAGTSNVMMRIDTALATGEDYIYIINGAQQKVWIYGDGEWTDLSVAYDTYWNAWSTTWEGYRTSLDDWTGLGDWSYTEGGATIRIYDINVNPSLSDSLFQP